MKIKSKLLLALLLVSLVPVTLGCFFSYFNTRSLLTHSFLNHLRSVASIQHARVAALLGQDLERLALVASRTQLRLSLARFDKSGSPGERERMNRILADALASIHDFAAITVYGRNGVAVAATDAAVLGRAHFDPDFFRRCQQEFAADYFFLDADGRLMIYLSGPLTLEGKLLGVLVVKSQVDNILALVGDYSGLGATGETLLVKRDANGDAVFLTPTRFDPKAALRRVLGKDLPYAANSSFAGEKVLLDSIDYRQQPVLAVGRYIPQTDWGMVVKIDKDEAYAPVARLRNVLWGMVVVCMTVVVAVATVVARGISSPIDNLARLAGGIAGGDLSRRAAVSSSDEIGLLAGTFNEMLDRLQLSSRELEGKIEQLNNEIDAHERVEAEKEELIKELQQALAEIKTLKGIVPICASCKKIRDDKGFWNQLEAYIRDHSEAEFSHSICPECARKLYPDINFPEDLL